MINIGICDDNVLIQKQIGNAISDYFSSKKYSYSLFSYSLGSDLLKACKNIDFSFIFVDIDLGRENGVEIAKAIRKTQDKPISIIFITNYPEYQTKVFSIHTFDYLIKPITNIQIHKTLDDLLFWHSLNTNIERKRLRFKTIHGLITIYVDDIVYFEYNNRRIDIVTKNAIYHMYDKVKNIVTLMEKYDFISPHSAYVINMNEVTKYLKSDSLLIMSNGSKVPISQLKAKWFRTEYMNYINKMWKEKHD